MENQVFVSAGPSKQWDTEWTDFQVLPSSPYQVQPTFFAQISGHGPIPGTGHLVKFLNAAKVAKVTRKIPESTVS